jgi:hypothetical protein
MKKITEQLKQKTSPNPGPVGRYQLFWVPNGEQPFLVRLDTITGKVEHVTTIYPEKPDKPENKVQK